MSIELMLLGEILRLSRDSDVSLEEFGEKVASSPHLAAEIVRVSNSALYGMEGRINRLERAVLILGIRTVASIASSVLVAAKVRGVKVGGLNHDALWIHSLETGVCAQLIARCLGLPADSEAYLAGLLHDLGMLELHQAHGKRYAEIVLQAGREKRSLHEVEQEVLSETHCSRLFDLAAEWGFPEPLQQALGYHHSPLEAPEASRTVASLVYAAHILVTDPAGGWTDQCETAEDTSFLEELGLASEDVDDIRGMLDEKMKEVAAVFQ